MKNLLQLLCFSCLLIIISCTKNEVNDCNITKPEIISIETIDAPCGEESGSLEINSNGGIGQLSYSVDGINFSSQNRFTNLPPNLYQVTVRDENNCETTTEILISSGVSFAEEVAPVIQNTCGIGGCHAYGGPAPNFNLTESIFSFSSQIKSKLVADVMPPPNSGKPRLTETERANILCWINDGSPDN